MQINFKGQYDKDTFFKAVRLANQPAKNRNGLLYFMLVVALGGLVVLGRRIIETGDIANNFVFILAALIMGGLAAFNLLRPYFAARKLWANPGVRRLLKGQITNLGVVYNFPEGTNEIPWSHFARLRKKAGLITLVRRDGLLVVFPRQFFKNSNDWEKFGKLVDKKVIVTDRPFPRKR